jgi:hypothetical protein
MIEPVCDFYCDRILKGLPDVPVYVKVFHAEINHINT